MIRNIGLWFHRKSAEWPWMSWAIHGIMSLPCIAMVAWQPWTAPGMVFFYREAEQVWFRYLTKQGYVWLDHIMDVAVPLGLGFIFLR